MASVFFERYAKLCKSINETPNSVAKEIGASSGSVTAWKNGTEPRYSTVAKIADYFDTTVDFLLGRTDDPENSDRFGLDDLSADSSVFSPLREKTLVLTEKDERDIARILEKTMADLESSGDLMFDGDPMSPEARESIRSALKLGLEAAKLKNKEIYTPKKYRKG